MWHICCICSGCMAGASAAAGAAAAGASAAAGLAAVPTVAACALMRGRRLLLHGIGCALRMHPEREACITTAAVGCCRGAVEGPKLLLGLLLLLLKTVKRPIGCLAAQHEGRNQSATMLLLLNALSASCSPAATAGRTQKDTMGVETLVLTAV